MSANNSVTTLKQLQSFLFPACTFCAVFMNSSTLGSYVAFPIYIIGSKNPRKMFQAELADPYAKSDASIVKTVDAALRVVCMALSETPKLETELPDDSLRKQLLETVPSNHVDGVILSLEYLRDRIGVPRDLPLAAGRYLRAYLNWGIDVLSSDL